MAQVTLSKLVKNYDETPAVRGIDLDISDKEFVVLVGPSGCGKSTTLRMIAGLEDITGGEVLIGGDVVNDVPPKDRDIAMVFQNYALYQHMTVYDNLAFGLRNRKVPEAKIKAQVDQAVAMLGIAELLRRKPRQLSGGQQQRVALGRCITREPELFLLDDQHRPRFVAGVPPDYFSSQGQLWGNPVYNWDALRRTGYRWWIERFRRAFTLVDIARIDHFRGFAGYWEIPACEKAAGRGRWVKGADGKCCTSVSRRCG